MLIKYNHPSLLSFGFNAELGKCEVTLKPGLNEVQADFWKKHKSNPSIQLRIDEGVIEVVGEEEDVSKPSKVLTSMKPGEALSAVKDTIDLEILSEWLAKEKRPNVKKAIQKQIDDVKAPPVYRDKKDSATATGE